MIGRKASHETREKIASKHRGKVLSPETRKKLSERIITEEWKSRRVESIRRWHAAHPDAFKGRKVSDETREKISMSKIGKKNPAISASNKRRAGSHRKPHSEETKDKIRQAHIRRWLSVKAVSQDRV